MHKNYFSILPNKALIYEDSITMSQSIIHKNNGNDTNKNKNIKKLKESFYNKDFKHQNTSDLTKLNNDSLNIILYFIKKNLEKYSCSKNSNIDLVNINYIFQNKKCHFTAVYKDVKIYNNTKEYLKNYYKYNESIKIIPKREAYFKHLMQFLERPVFRNFINNKIINQGGFEKLGIYRRINYQKKFNKNIDLNNNICNNNIIFNSNVIETIENCSTSITQYSNRNNQNIPINERAKEGIIKSNNNVPKDTSMISEIKNNNCINKKNDNNISCIDNSLLMVMKDLSISQNKINAYLCQHNTNYKNLYNKIKNKAKMHTITNKNDLEDNGKNIVEEKKTNLIKDIENNNIIKKTTGTKKLSNINFYNKILKKSINNNLDKYKKQKNAIENNICHNSVFSHKKINNIKIIPFKSNNLNSQINNKNSCCIPNKYCLSSTAKNQPLIIHNLKKKFNGNRSIFNKDNKNFCKYFNSNTYKEKNNNMNVLSFINNKNNGEILKKIRKIVEIKEPKNKSMKKHINMQKFLTESSICMLDLNSLNENEAKKKYQTINAVKSISISNNQFFNMKNEFKRNNYK